MKKIGFGIVLGLFFLAVVFPIKSYALGIDLAAITKLKSYDTQSLEEFSSTTKKIEQPKPYGDPLLGYQFLLPKEWTDNILTTQAQLSDESVNINDSIFSMIARYASDSKNLGRSSIRIEAQKLGYEIKAVHWFVNEILSNGLSLTALNVISDKEVQGLYVEVIKDVSYIIRAHMFINGDKIIMMRYYLPQDNYEQEKNIQARVVESFKLVNPSNDKIEKQEIFGFLDQSYFNYPTSWRLKEKPILTIERMSVTMFQETMQREDLVLEGYIKVNAISRLLNTTLAQEVKIFKEGFKVPDYTVGNLIETIEFKKDPSIKILQTQVYELVPNDRINKRQYELLISLLQGDEYHYIVSMISPSRDFDFYGWAKNREVARIVVESLRRHKDPMGFDASDPYYDYLKESP